MTPKASSGTGPSRTPTTGDTPSHADASRGRRGLDLLTVPALGRFLRWRHARTVLQSVCLALAALILLDGWFGPQLAPRNLAGVLPWVHWRGFVVLALLVAGNLFCMACPFMLPRRLAKRFLPADRPWPAPLRSKWLAVGLLILFFWAYEAFSLWASPWLTAWVAASYFLLAFVIDGFFRGASFCRFVCPIGQFHFVNAMVSPTEIRVRDPDVCGRCETLDCIRGRYEPGIVRETGPARSVSDSTAANTTTGAGVSGEPGDGDSRSNSPNGHPRRLGDWEGRPLRPDAGGRLALAGAGGRSNAGSGRAYGRVGLVQGGCELALYQPRKEGNLDCTFCMECIHACPHDNVGFFTRSPLRDLAGDPVRSGVGRLSARPDLAALALLLTYAAFLNAFGMVEPVFALQEWIAVTLGITTRAGLLLGFFVVGLVLLPATLTLITAAASRTLAPLPTDRLPTGQDRSGSSSGPGDPGTESLTGRATRFAWGLVPLGFGMWTAHYLYHLLIGGLTLVPVVQEYLGELGLPAGDPAWGLGAMVPESWLFPIQLLTLQGGLLVTLVVLYQIARQTLPNRRGAARAFLPWALLATLLAGAGIWLLLQPMEMRGTFLV